MMPFDAIMTLSDWWLRCCKNIPVMSLFVNFMRLVWQFFLIIVLNLSIFSQSGSEWLATTESTPAPPRPDETQQHTEWAGPPGQHMLSTQQPSVSSSTTLSDCHHWWPHLITAQVHRATLSETQCHNLVHFYTERREYLWIKKQLVLFTTQVTGGWCVDQTWQCKKISFAINSASLRAYKLSPNICRDNLEDTMHILRTLVKNWSVLLVSISVHIVILDYQID